ncbi:hypothetical protein EU528_07245 [Candidatus Thorarchaeota archaeon]|nr:MAG: hypothetical protein EU528_07245 [Candidatus Thorarchaeota archaeon]
MSGSEIEEENILGHLHAAMKMATKATHENPGISMDVTIAPEYACLRTMMLEPQNPTMWNSMALVYLMTGRYEDAQDAIERSLDLDSGIAWTWSIWGDLLAQIGDELESERAYRMAMELGSIEPHVLNQLVRYFFKRKNYSETLELLEILIPQNLEDQSLWDLYTACFSRV